MTLLTIKIAPSSLAAVLKAIAPLVPSHQIELYEPAPIPPMDDGLDELAKKVVDAIRPKSTQPMRRDALRTLARGHDTFFHQRGEPDAALRNAMGAISKALRSVFGHDQAIRRLAIPRKTFWDDGSYQGTVYEVTPLGERVFELLKAEGSI
ncbi:hypothetical protein KEM44_06345 (plasmid) [Sinorhizobium meliloti]|uniref:hypothetical protein n=1 Tax=Rhizobium meliloti TaxID=382 RepID=UPI000B5A98AB|nr:hypothetical protein [Sinorhizobium meliloti]ASJ62239.1 hypothetical protein SMB554_24850 [Sinorhizobium meliloti]MCK3785908.1 hypothetical protein [Sinorhizobium meliloti]MCK3790816.1 hypothetical protein [Sinorhizobium meliloti]MCK3798055.1 hypothetical protein [Sinorhizobium meliloti]MDW9527618.1 hypothetical protein [Sinorhizobium meliloti]